MLSALSNYYGNFQYKATLNKTDHKTYRYLHGEGLVTLYSGQQVSGPTATVDSPSL